MVTRIDDENVVGVKESLVEGLADLGEGQLARGVAQSHHALAAGSGGGCLLSSLLSGLDGVLHK